MRRHLSLLAIGCLVIIAGFAPRAASAPEDSPSGIPLIAFYDMKSSRTRVGFNQPVPLSISPSPDNKRLPPFFSAAFITKGYKTEPPEFVILEFYEKPSQVMLKADELTMEPMKSLPSENPQMAIYAVPRHIFEQWLKANRMSIVLNGNDERVISAGIRGALRELSRRMVPRRALTFYHGRESLTATTLDDGRVLVAGGYDGIRALKNCEMYDPATGRFATGLKMQFPRRNHTATLLKDGRVLLVGGGVDGSDTALDSAELFDPAKNQFLPAGKMRDARMSHTATLLQDGRVLIAGGGGKAPLAGAEIYDPATNSFHSTGNLNRRRLGHTATLLNDGRVFIAGGVDGEALKSVELYDSMKNEFSAADDMLVPRWEHTASLLPDGSVLIAGGHGSPLPMYKSAELFSADKRSPEKHSNRHVGWGHVAVSLTDGRVLLAGGHADVNIDYPWLRPGKGPGTDNSFLLLAKIDGEIDLDSRAILLTPRRHFAAATLKDGRILFIGGLNLNNPALNTAEFYDPKTDEIIPWRDVVNGEK